MPRTASKLAELTIIGLFLVIGFVAVAVPTAYGTVVSAGSPAPSVTQQKGTLDAAQAACVVLKGYSRVSECHVIEWNPSIDFVINATRPEAVQICDRAVSIIASKTPQIADKGWKIRVFSSAAVPPTASCSLRG